MATATADALDAYGADVQRLTFEWGEPVDPEAIRQGLQADPEIKAVMITHNETSTGVTHDLQSIAGVVKGEFGKLLLVGRGQQPGLLAPAGGRVGLRRGLHRVAEGLYDTAGAGLYQLWRRRLGGAAVGHDAQVLL